MPLFLSDEEFSLLSNDATAVAERADAFICNIRQQLDVVRAESDAKYIADEQNCALLEQKYVALCSEFSKLQYENAQLSASSEKSLSELADAQTEKHQLHIETIGKDREIEKLSLEGAELRISKRQLLELVEQKDAEIRERNVTIQSYVDKIVHLTENTSSKESKLFEIESELMRCQAICARLSQEKELLEKQNVWLDEELSTKVNSLFGLRKTQMDVEAELSGKITDLERQAKEYFDSLNHGKDRIKELELRIKSLEEDLCSSKDIASTNEQHLNTELLTVNKLVELYKASSEEWSRKAGELEGVIKALETHLSQVEDGSKEKLEKETSLRKDFEKEVTDLNLKLKKCEAELENTRKANESSLLPLSLLPVSSHAEDLVIYEPGINASQILVPRIAAGVSGTALAASLLRDGWSLTKMYEKYQETSDALRHEKWGRKHAEAVLERILHEIEEKAEMILEERVEHERMVEAYAAMNEKLQQAIVEHDNSEQSSRNLKAELRRRERECLIAQKEITDLQKQVSVLLKECQDIQLRCGGNLRMPVVDTLISISSINGDVINADTYTSEHPVLTFKDINELVEQNVKLRSLVHKLSTDEEKREAEMRDNFHTELQRATDEASSKVEVVLKRSEEQTCLIESLHNSVAMYKRLYEEEHKIRTSNAFVSAVSDNGKKELTRLLEGSQEVSKKAYDQLSNRAKILEEDVARLSTELISARADRDKMSLEAEFSKERLDSFVKEFDHQRVETNSVSARNLELTHLLIDYQKRLRESSASLQVSEENARKLSMEVSILKHEREILLGTEKRNSEEIQTLMERVRRLQSSLDTLQSAEEIRENSRLNERKKQDDYVKRLERDWAEVKRDIQEERDRVRALTHEKERAIETSMGHVEDIRKELANAWHSVTAAESRAAVAEARYFEIEAKINRTGKEAIAVVGDQDPSGLSANGISEELWKAKQELEKLKEEICSSKEYMLQYKELARTNENALKQMELAHEDYKLETLKLKKVLEDETQSLKNRILELEQNYMLKCEEAVSATEAKETALSAAMVETSRLRDEVAENLGKANILEVLVSSLKDDVEKEHRRWRIAQDNYERQVILQSETIQELTDTSKELSLRQAEISRLRDLLDAQKSENELLKLSWDTEKSELRQIKTEAERKCNEMDEQNRILHNRLEALHVRLAEKAHNSTELSSVSSKGDSDLQTVINYLRRSKEIAETEITLLKQEKLRLQSQLDGSRKALESAQALLHSQLENSRELLLKDEEFKSLQLQVREINLLRESNVQLREENKHNFEECQKFREMSQKVKSEADDFENLLKQKQIEVDGFQKDAELLKIEISDLNNKNAEILESCKNINNNELELMKDELEQVKNTVAEKQESIMKLEHDLVSCHDELSEREKKLNEAQKVEVNLKQEIDRHKRQLAAWKNKNQSIAKDKEELHSKNQTLIKEIEEFKVINQTIMKEKEELSSRNLVLAKEKEDASTKTQASTKEKDEFDSKLQGLEKEKEELSSKNQALMKQVEDFKAGRKVLGESEQSKKEQEKDTRIQMLEKTLDRVRVDYLNEKQARKKTQMLVVDCTNKINVAKQKVDDELQKHRSAISAVLEKAGIVASQFPSGSSLDEQTLAYFQSISSLEAAVTSFVNDVDGSQSSPASVASTLDTLSASAGQKVPSQQTKLSKSNTKIIDERENSSSSGKANPETRRPVRRFVRPSLEKPEGNTADAEVTSMEIPTASDGKTVTSIDIESLAGDVPAAQPTLARKRLTPCDSGAPEGSAAIDELNVPASPPSKKIKEQADLSEINTETCNILPSSENFDSTPIGTSLSDAPASANDEDGVPINEELKEQLKGTLETAYLDEADYEGADAIIEGSDKLSALIEEPLDPNSRNGEKKQLLYSAAEGEEDNREEGELMLCELEQQPDEPELQPEDLPSDEGAGSGDEAVVMDAVEIASPSNEQTAAEAEDAAEDSERRNTSTDQIAPGDVEQESAISSSQNLASAQLTPSTPAEAGDSQTARGSRTISISETAKRNAQLRQARLAAQQQPQQQQQKPPSRGGRIPMFRRDSNRGSRGRGGRG